VLLLSLVCVAWAVLVAPHDIGAAIDLALDPAQLTRAAIVTTVCLVLWVAVVVSTFAVLRPSPAERRWHVFGGSAFVGAMCLAVVAPVGLLVRDAFAQAHVVTAVFSHNGDATRPSVTPEDPWHGRSRVNVLLLGGDSGPDREGTRTDTMILASLDTRTGRTVTFGLPRNLADVPFPSGSPLHDLYPDGFTGAGDPASWMLNAVYREVPILHPHLLGRSTDEGADAVKLAVQGATGLHVDYYVLVDFTGFRQLVDAIGGITVNVNVPVAINGQTDAGIPPTGYIEPGPDQHLDGFHALWYARGRYGADDYQRMARQRCVINAIIDEADPVNLLRRYQALATAGSRVVSTDIPRELLPAFVKLALKAKDRRAKSVLFRISDQFNPNDPDFDYVHQVVRKALAAPAHRRRHRATSPAQDDADACAYHPGQSY
jgi:LCP family protein required for cell wall assembly